MSNMPDKITFAGSQGDSLAARLEMPAGRPRAFAIFAHCFTCSKDIFAAARIAGALAERDIAVLRFDFTGLGQSEGDFANTNFSSNVQDLVAAADWLRSNHEAPAILIGHSLGGAAVLAAAGDIPETRAVATIGAPAEAEHVIHNFGVALDEIGEKGVAKVKLAGRDFTIKKQFLDDVSKQVLKPRIAGLKKALLVFHAPRDATVGIENAAEIFTTAKHPKSFVSLDDADHLLSRRKDAIYVADVLSAWARRYLEEPAEAESSVQAPENGVLVSETGGGKFQQLVLTGDHRLIADEPKSVGGLATGPSPYDFLSTALGTCTAMTLRIYADHKGLALDKVSVLVDHGKVHAEDCVDCGEGKTGRIDRFERTITVTGDLDDAARQRLLEIADKCPVHKTLEKGAAVVSKLTP